MKRVQILKKESSELLQAEIKKFIEGVGPLTDILEITFHMECDSFSVKKARFDTVERHILYIAFIIYSFENSET